MIYLAFTLWLFLIVFAGVGVYRMLCDFGKPRWIDWILLPGTLVSQMCYIFGCLITGAEVRRAKLIPSEGGEGESTDAEPKLKFLGPIIASLLAMIGCIAAIVIVHALLGDPVLKEFSEGDEMLAQSIPTSWSAFWERLHDQVSLSRITLEAWASSNWLDWRVPVFTYLAICLSIRLAPVSRAMRPTLAAAVLVALLIAIAGLISSSFDGLVQDVWPLLSYIWSNLLVLLLAILLARGIMALVRILKGHED